MFQAHTFICLGMLHFTRPDQGTETFVVLWIGQFLDLLVRIYYSCDV